MIKPKNQLSIAYWCGFIFHGAFSGAYQDFLGKAEYIKLVNENWMNTSPYMWVAIASACLVVYVWLQNRIKE